MKINKRVGKIAIAPAVAIALGTVALLAAALSMIVPVDHEAVSAQQPTATPDPTGRIAEIKPSVGTVTLNPGTSVTLSIRVIGLQNVGQGSLASDVVFNWSASGGDLQSDGKGNTSAHYTAPTEPGNYNVSVTASSNCRSKCTAVFNIRVRRPGSDEGQDGLAVNPSGTIPTLLTDGENNQYEVFTPEEGGNFNGDDFRIEVPTGAVKNGEYIGVRMYEDGLASNSGMEHHNYTLSGANYTVAVVDGDGDSVPSYQLNDVSTICVPLPPELLPKISDVQMIGTYDGGVSLTGFTSATRLGRTLSVCGFVSKIPVTVAVGVQGAPPPLPTPVPTPVPELPPTGGASPSTSILLVLAIATLLAFLATGALALTARHRRR